MKKTPLFCAMAVAALFAGPADAIFKCTTGNGVVYQDRPCREGTETDVLIVIPTGELAPKAGGTQDESTQSTAGRVETRFGAPKAGRTGDESPAITRPGERRSSSDGAPGAADTAPKRDQRAAAENAVPMTAEQARRTEPAAKYYTTDAAAPGAEIPEQMTCESPTGEKRRFILTNGKLTSI